MLLILHLLLPLTLIVGSKFIKELAVHLHKCLQNVINKSYDRLIPMLLANPVQRWEHNTHNYMIVFLN